MNNKKKKQDPVKTRLDALEEEIGELQRHLVLDPSDVELLRQAVSIRNAAGIVYEQQTILVERLLNHVSSQYDSGEAETEPIVSLGQKPDDIGLLVWPAKKEEEEQTELRAV